MRRLSPLALLCLTLAACGSTHSGASATSGSAASTTSASTPPPTTSSPAAGGPCHSVAAPTPKPAAHLSAPHITLDPHKTYTVAVATNCGTFAFMLDVKGSPRTSASFYYLVRRHFFDGITFHRVATGFVIQGGDPTGTGAGGPGYTVVEPPPQDTQYVLGDVAMAKTQADPSGASGSQFFIVTARSVTLTPDYALLGKVVSGMGVVQRIGALPTNPPGDGMPSTPVVMSRVTVSAS